MKRNLTHYWAVLRACEAEYYSLRGTKVRDVESGRAILRAYKGMLFARYELFCRGMFNKDIPHPLRLPEWVILGAGACDPAWSGAVQLPKMK